jgi:hypothetical protein
VRQLCLGFSVLNANRSGSCIGFDYARYWSRSLATALAAQSFCLRVRVLAPEESFTCGLLADIGSLAIASLYPERFSEVLAGGAAGRDRSVVEREAFGADHLEFGAALLEDWRLPKICVDAVFHSELPEQSGFDPASRSQVVCELLALSRRVGDYFVADPQAPASGSMPTHWRRSATPWAKTGSVGVACSALQLASARRWICARLPIRPGSPTRLRSAPSMTRLSMPTRRCRLRCASAW